MTKLFNSLSLTCVEISLYFSSILRLFLNHFESQSVSAISSLPLSNEPSDLRMSVTLSDFRMSVKLSDFRMSVTLSIQIDIRTSFKHPIYVS